MLVPYSTHHVVACPFGFTVPVAVAVVGPTAVTGPVIAVGAAAVAAELPPAVASATAARSRPITDEVRMLLNTAAPCKAGARMEGVLFGRDD